MDRQTAGDREVRIHRAGLARGAGLLALLLLGAAAAPGAWAGETDMSRPDANGAPTSVRVGLYLADLHEVSGADQTFLADVVVVAEWLDPRLAGRWASVHSMPLDDVWNPRLQLVNQRGVTAQLPHRVEIEPSGRATWRQRWLGRFSARLDLRDFPVDRQRFQVQVVSMGYTRDEVDLIVNSESQRSGRAEQLTVTDWAVGTVQAENADFDAIPRARVLAGAQLQWEGQRHIRYYALQVILPLVLIVLMGWTSLWVDPSVVPARVSLAMTTMLTIIAYRFALGNSIPKLAYLTRFDYFMLASTVLVFVILLLVAACAYLVGKGRVSLVRRIDFWARLAFPVAFGVVCVLTWWWGR